MVQQIEKQYSKIRDSAMNCKWILMLVAGLILIVIGLAVAEPDLDLSRGQSMALVFAFWALWHIGATLLAWCAWISVVSPAIRRD